MSYKVLTKDYVSQEILDTISHMQRSDQEVPDLTSVQIEKLAEDFLFEWTEVGNFSADFSRSVAYFLIEQFKMMSDER